MPSGTTDRVLQTLYHLMEWDRFNDVSDRQLLKRFTCLRDEGAFGELVRRHGPMLLRVCQRVLRDWHDAEDAVQAVFLVLARKAASVRWHESVGGWLFQVAYHLALKMRRRSWRGRMQLSSLKDLEQKGPSIGETEGELGFLFDEELSRLPEKYRSVLILFHYEGKSRSDAARQLGCKEGTVKIRLERARKMLRARLVRRGVVGTVALWGVECAANRASAGTPTVPVEAVASRAKLFASGQPVACVSESVIALTEGVFRTMFMSKLKIAGFVMLAACLCLLGAGGFAIRAWNDARSQTPPETPARAAPVQARKKAPAPTKKPLRVLLFASGPSREYQFLRTLLVREMDKRRAEVSIHLQLAPGISERKTGVVQDVPPERLLSTFPTRLEGGDKDDKLYALDQYDVIVAFDPDWTKVAKTSLEQLEKWVRVHKGGLIVVAGPLHALDLVRPNQRKKLKPVIDLYPVRLHDPRLDNAEIDASQPHALSFPGAGAGKSFLKLDPEGRDPLAGWPEFFFGKACADWKTTDDRPIGGFFQCYPIEGVKPKATVIARMRAPNDSPLAGQPFLVTMPYERGVVVYLGSGETWRMRQFDQNAHARFWMNLMRYVSSANPRPEGGRKIGAKSTPAERRAIEKGLAWLVKQQHRDGHWESAGGQSSFMLTAMAGLTLLMEGSTIREGKYKDNIRRATDWLMGHATPKGLIHSRLDVEAFDYVSGHAFAMQFLASAYGDEEDLERRKKLGDVLTRAVVFADKAQTAKGGWGGVATKEGDNHDTKYHTALMVQALRTVRMAGLPVPRATIVAGQKYLIQNVKPANIAVEVVLAGAFGAEEYNVPAVKKWLRDFKRLAPVLEMEGVGSFGEPHDFYVAQVTYALGDSGYVKLFPESKTEDRITWSEYRKKSFAHLLKTQRADGSWDGSVSATSQNLAILLLENNALPNIHR
jgi:RNA polymerase sigma factor (sigma-70 family)